MVPGVAAGPRVLFRLCFCLAAAQLNSLGCVALCLGDPVLKHPVPEAQRRSLPVPGGSGEVPFGIWAGTWPSSMLMSHLIKLLAEEVLGFRTNISAAANSVTGLYATAGCHAPRRYSGDQGCEETPAFSHHLCPEIWGLVKVSIVEKIIPAQNMPENLGSVGYDGVEGIHVLQREQASAYGSLGLSLEHYTAYDNVWQKPLRFFDNISAIQPTHLQLCSETNMHEAAIIDIYERVTGDSEGVVEVEGEGEGEGKGNNTGKRVARCWRDSWWAGPACRGDLESCVPILTLQAGWFTHDIMQKAAVYNLPWAFASVKNTSLWQAIPKETKVLIYWWKPDASFVGFGASLIDFPTHDKEARARGSRASAAAGTILWKAVHRQLWQASPRLRDFALRVSLSLPHMQNMLWTMSKEGDGHAYEQTACDWARANGEIWMAWIPPVSDCISGQGLVDKQGDPLLNIENLSAAAGCAWCKPGYVSTTLQQEQGQGQGQGQGKSKGMSNPNLNPNAKEFYVCLPCEPGKSQANPGHQECGKCSQGTFAQAAGSSECHRCAIGRYQPSVGSSACEHCGHPRTTALQGSANASDCVCPEDFFAPASPTQEGPCVPCPEGMKCILGGAPLPRQRYYTTLADPLSVYACPDDSCSGGGPERCIRNTEGLACGGCHSGYFRSTHGCEPCKGSVHNSHLAISACVAMLSPLAVCLLYMKSKDPLDKWGSPANSMGAVAYLGLAFVQIVATSQMAPLAYPDEAAGSVRWTTVTVDVMTAFHPGCSDFLSFHMIFLLRLLMPLYTLVVFLGTWIISRILERCFPGCHMDGNGLAACFGNVYMMFFVGIAAQTFSLFRCYRHPNGKFSLVSAPDILCGSRSWQDLVLASVIAIVVWCGGALAFTTYINFQTPLHFHRELFRRRWRFLLLRYRPKVWWWGSTLMLKGVLLQLTLVIFSESRDQLVWLTSTNLLYLVAVCSLMPWRSLRASSMDVLMHSMLLAIFSILPFYLAGREVNPLSLHAFLSELGLCCCLSPLIAASLLVLIQLGRTMWSPGQWLQRAEGLCGSFERIRCVEELVKLLQVQPALDVFVLERAFLISQRLLLFEHGDNSANAVKQRLHSSMFYDEITLAALKKALMLDANRAEKLRQSKTPELLDLSSVRTAFV